MSSPLRLCILTVFCALAFTSTSTRAPGTWERVVTTLNPHGEPLDFRYSEKSKYFKGFSNRALSAPGCPKSIDFHQFLYSRHKPPRCFLVATRGPCKEHEYFMPYIYNQSVPFGVCFSSVKLWKQKDVEWENYICSLGHISCGKWTNGIQWMECPAGQKYSLYAEKCTEALALPGIG